MAASRNIQDVQDDVDRLEPSEKPRSQAADDSMGEHDCSIDAAGHCQHVDMSDGGDGLTYNVCALVAEYVCPDPMLAAAVICTAQPQSMDATDATDPIVLASGVQHAY